MSVHERNVFQVGELVSTLKHGLEMNFPSVWVEGEISNFVLARSGHWYFTLKDENSQIRCAFFRNRNLRHQPPQSGQRVLLKAQPSIFLGRGELQLIVDDIEDAGLGALHLAFERLKQKLSQEGLFAPSNKKLVPNSPRCIGLITSSEGAAVHDVLTTLQRRNPLSRVILYPSSVQGVDAPKQLMQALKTAQRRAECDVILITRGGGSLEDLQAFNDEALAREIARCEIPILSAVGHEVDFSICDFVADERAATPTAAAERLSPDQSQAQLQIRHYRARMQQTLKRYLQQKRSLSTERLARLESASPQRRLLEAEQRLDHLSLRLRQRVQQSLNNASRQYRHTQQRLNTTHPHVKLKRALFEQTELTRRLQQACTLRLRNEHRNWQHCQQRLLDLGPQQVLKRGYSITWHQDKILRNANLPAGEAIKITLASGELYATVSKPD